MERRLRKKVAFADSSSDHAVILCSFLACAAVYRR
jgi:hypothetical protein